MNILCFYTVEQHHEKACNLKPVISCSRLLLRYANQFLSFSIPSYLILLDVKMFLSSDSATNEFYISICTLCTVCLQSIRFAEQCCDTQIVHVIVHHVLDKLHSYEFNSRPLLCPPEVKVPYFVLPRSRSLTLSCWGKGHLLCPAEVKVTYFVLLR